MSLTALRHVPLLALVLLAGACASEPLRWRYLNEEGAASPQVWPAPPEQARYRFVGMLTGEQNLTRAAGEASTARRFLRFLVGLDAPARDPLVLLRPQSGMVDAEGRILVTDAARQAVFVFDPSAPAVHVWEHAAVGERFVSPVGIAAGAGGNVLVADAGLARVVRLSREGVPLGGFSHERLKRPAGLARDARTGRVYVADVRAHDLKVFDDRGALLAQIGRRGTDPGEFNAPTHLALVDGRLYVTDTFNARVQVLEPGGRALASIGGRGLFVGNLVRPKGVTADPNGNVYVVESLHDHLLVFNAAGEFLMPIGGTGAGVGRFVLPAGAWSDPQGRIFVADMFNGRVMIFQYLGSG